MTKIAHLTSVHPPFDTRIYHKECSTLAAGGYEVVLVATGAAVQNTNSVRVKIVPQANGRFQRMTVTARAVVQAALAERAALYHFHDPELLPWAFLLQRRGHHVIFDMHENIRGALLTKPWLHPVVRLPIAMAYEALERLLMTNMPVIFAEESYARLYPWLQQTTTVLNLPSVETLHAIQAPKHTQFTVGYIGGVSALRGSKVTMEALTLLRHDGVEIGFDCVGPLSAGHQSDLETVAQTAGLHHIHFYGKLPQHEGWTQIAACHAGLALLQNTPNYIESYPTKMFEYMALGLPVVVSDFPLYRSVVERAQCGLCVDPANPEAIAEAIRRLYTDLDAAERMGENGRRFVMKKMNWATEAHKLLDFYASILAGSVC